MFNRKLILFDGNSVTTAAYFGVTQLSNSKGVPTNATYGFITSLFKVLLNENFPTHCGVVFDSNFSHRKEISPTYKSHRKPLDSELYEQYPYIKRFLNIMRIPYFEVQGYEGDDLLAIISTKFYKDIPIKIVTRDRDLLQLCALPNTTISLTNFSKSGASTRDMQTREVEEMLGVTPEQIIILKSLEGDSSDNIKGVPGIGRKTALKLIKEYGTLEEIVSTANSDEIRPKRIGKLIRDNIGSLYESYSLAKLITKDIFGDELTLDSLQRRPADEKALCDFYVELEFNSFLS